MCVLCPGNPMMRCVVVVASAPRWQPRNYISFSVHMLISKVFMFRRKGEVDFMSKRRDLTVTVHFLLGLKAYSILWIAKNVQGFTRTFLKV